MKSKLLKLDFGCGRCIQEGFEGVDIIPFPGVTHVVDLLKPWPWGDNSVDEANCGHMIEHFDPMERCHFANELYRVLKPAGKCTLSAPHWSSCRAYGDPTHKWPPVSEEWFYYLSRAYRTAKAPHTDAKNLPGGLNCDFDVTWVFSLTPDVHGKEAEQFAMKHLRDACLDVIATMVAKKVCTYGRNGKAKGKKRTLTKHAK